MANKTWIGGAGAEFNVAGDWSPSGEPGTGDVAVIGAGSTVLFDANSANSIEIFQDLQLADGAQLTINSGDFVIADPTHNSVLQPGIDGVLQVNGGVLMIGAGVLSLQGAIDLGPDGELQTAGPTLTLADFNLTGGIMLQGGSFGGRIAAGGAGTYDTLINESSIIHGYGYVGANAGFLDLLNIVNQDEGTIAADVAGQQLVVDDLIANDGGTLMAIDGGTLVVDGSVNQTQVAGLESGRIDADDNSTVLLDHASIIGGGLDATDSGTVRIGTLVTLDGVGISALVQLDSGATLELTGIYDSGLGATIDASSGTLIANNATIANFPLITAGGNLLFVGNANVLAGTETFNGGFSIGPGQLVSFGDGTAFGTGAANLMFNTDTIVLAGALVADIDNGATLGIDSSSLPVQLSGGGTVTMPDPLDLITGTDAAAASALFENINNTIIGIGSIDNIATLTVDSTASIIASGGTLVLNATDIVNAGFLGAVPGSTLEILGKLTNTGQLSGLVVIGGPVAGLVDGTLAAGGTIVIAAPGGGVYNLVNHGKIIVEPNAVLNLTGDTDNTGIIDLNGSGPGHQATIVLAGMLDGGGTILLDNGDIESFGSTPFTNVNNIIKGSGNLGTGGLAFVNQGVVDADLPGGILGGDPTTPSVQNLALMEATNGGTLTIVGPLIDTDITDNTFVGSGVGTLLASGAGSLVGLLGGSVTEGLLDSTDGGQIQVQGAETLLLGAVVVVGTATVPYAVDSALTNFADLRILAGQTLTLAPAPGALGAVPPSAVMNNNSTISLRGTFDAGSGQNVGATLLIAAATIELDSPAPGVISDGTGVLTLNNAADRIIGAAAGDMLVNQETIAGYGQLGAGALGLTNIFLIDANVAGQALFVQPSGSLDNEGILQASAGTLVVLGTVNENNEALLNASGTGVIKLGGLNAGGVAEGADIIGGNITSSAGGMVQTNGAPVTLDSTSVVSGGNTFYNYVSMYGVVTVQPGDTLTVADGLNNFGTLVLGGAGGGATLLATGTGLGLTDQDPADITLANAADAITGSKPGQTLVNQQNTITGGGTIDIGVTNLAGGTFEATTSMTIDTGGSTLQNNGVLAATGGQLLITGAVLNDNDDPDQTSPYSGTISVGGFAEADGVFSLVGGTVEVDGAITGTGVLKIEGGTMLLQGGVSAGQTIEASGFTPETLELGMPTTAPLVFTNFQYVDTIDLENVLATGSSFTAGVLHVTVGIADVDQLQFPTGYALSNFALESDNNGGTDVVIACFAAGTRILTATGEVPVEALRVGDVVATARRGKLARVQWLGHRHLDCRQHPDPHAVWPIRVQAGAFGPATPHADLLLSPDHAVFIGGSLIPIRYLVNGRSIAQEQHDEVTYWHVELPRHDILLAEGLATESYLDTGNRDSFAGSPRATTLHPDFAFRIWATESCAPLVLQGAELRAARGRLLDRAALLGYAITGDAAWRLLVDGQELSPTTIDGLSRFRLPAAARDVRLLSRAAPPAHTRDDGSDQRRLGVAVSRLILNGQLIALDDPRLGAGWHEVEYDSEGLAGWRWTNGDAALALTGPSDLDIHVVMTERYWADPLPTAATAGGRRL